MSRLLVSSSKY
ncbi:08135b59-9aed-4c70-9235-ea3be17a8423 [Thermothielavioides terrestris]|uniref:08135b59-9aed-4c70-9235-ea3be17a8423 n=1 Tax=Thermothielavioides terrestris TaxID=2587410 RepID=A0A446BK57_9PEZI|nr:08135b59-9aed-4c70-9235-ea3be17a8423 [Thermothielavioides terrestris]